MYVSQCLLILEGKSMDNTFTRLANAIHRLHGESRDVMIQPARAADSAFVMASQARGRVENWSETITAVGQRIVRLPLMLEEKFARLNGTAVEVVLHGLFPGEYAEA